MSFKVEMPKVLRYTVPNKDSLKTFVPYLVHDSEENMYSTIMTLTANDGDIIWFDSDGWIGKSSMEHFKEKRYTIIREYQEGEQLIITKQ